MRKRALITGASRGLGAVAVEAFSAEYDVVPFTRAQYDFLRPDERCEIPPVDIIIHCAGGGLGLREPCLSADGFYQLFMVNLGGAAEINRLAMPHMQENGWGRIIHICSIASGEAIGSVGYNTVKAALAAYVRSIGRELAPFGVVVTGISPGGFEAPDNAMARLKERSPEAYQEFTEKRLPRGHMGKAEELIPLLRYLISPEASMMGGCVVPIDAGEGRYY